LFLLLPGAEGTEGRLMNYGLVKIRNYRFMSLKNAKKYVSISEHLKVSEVARSPRGFFTQYINANGDKNKLDEYWIRRRNGFIARHLVQYKNNPTLRRWLALVMWAYVPSGPGWSPNGLPVSASYVRDNLK
jgi:hypothetical protein